MIVRFYVYAFADRDICVGEGFFVNNVNYEVHQWHPPAIYGRRGTPENGEGIALVRFKPINHNEGETYWYMLATFPLPTLTAQAVPDMIKFVKEQNLGVAE